MSYFVYILTILSTIFISYCIYKFLQKEVVEEKESNTVQEEILNEKKIDEELEKFYQLNTNKIKYSLYNPALEGLYQFSFIYELVIIENLWINEPFHSKFYEFLLLINDNNLMIIDPMTKVITMNMRDVNNKMQISKSYQVYSTKEIIMHAIPYCMPHVKRFIRNDSENLLISIFIIILKQSMHYQSKEIFQSTISKMLKNYEYEQDVQYIIELIEEGLDERFSFVQASIQDAFKVSRTFPYNETKIIKALETREKLPQKFLQKI